MKIECRMIKENEDGSAIVALELDAEAKEYLIGEGFLTVIKRALKTSESIIKNDGN